MNKLFVLHFYSIDTKNEGTPNQKQRSYQQQQQPMMMDHNQHYRFVERLYHFRLYDPDSNVRALNRKLHNICSSKLEMKTLFFKYEKL